MCTRREKSHECYSTSSVTNGSTLSLQSSSHNVPSLLQYHSILATVPSKCVVHTITAATNSTHFTGIQYFSRLCNFSNSQRYISKLKGVVTRPGAYSASGDTLTYVGVDTRGVTQSD